MWIDKIKDEFEKNPTATIAIGALVVGTVTKFIDTISAAQGRRAYAKQVNHRIKRRS